MQSVFLSHSFQDRRFAALLADRLRSRGISVWLAEAEMRVGDSLIEKIEAAIRDCSYLGVLLSPHSVSSAWVHREVRMALTQEIHGRHVKVLPLLYEKCDIPGFLLDKVYADFTLDFDAGFNALLQLLDAEPHTAVLLSDDTEFSADLETLARSAGFKVHSLKDLVFPWENQAPGTGITPHLIIVVRGEKSSQKNYVDLYGQLRRFVTGGGQLLATSWVCWEDLAFRPFGQVLPAEYVRTPAIQRENAYIGCRPTSDAMGRELFPSSFNVRTSFEVLRAKPTANVVLESEEGIPILLYHTVGARGGCYYLNSCQHWCGGAIESPLRSSLPLREGVATLFTWILRRSTGDSV